MKKTVLKITVIFLAVLFISQLHASEWSRIWGSTAVDENGHPVVDIFGNVYVAGTTVGAFGGETNVGSWDLCLTKFDISGSTLWTRIWGSTASDHIGSLDTDNSGNIYVTGRTGGNISGQNNNGDFDLVLTKFNGIGGELWTRLIGSAVADKGYDIAADSSEYIYACGSTEGSFDGELNSGGEDFLIVKYDSNGSNIWTRIIGSTTNDIANGICVDNAQNIYVAGDSSGGFGGQSALGAQDAYLVKYNTNGQLQWTRIFGTATSDYFYGVCVDNAGYIYAAGSTRGSIGGQINNGSADLLLTKFNSEGSNLWSRIWGSSTYDSANDVCIGSDGNIYITGYTWGEFGGQTNAGFSDLCLAKFNSDGNILASKIWGASGPDSGCGIDADPFENIYVAGSSYGTFGGQTHIGDTDLCLTRFYGQCPPNDNFVNAIEISETNVTVIGTNVNATAETGEPVHAGSPPNHSIWWKWTAPFDGELSIGTFGTYFDTVIAAYTGDQVNNLTLIDENDDVWPFSFSNLSTDVTAGVTYNIVVDSGSAGDTGIIKLNIDFIPEPVSLLFTICYVIIIIQKKVVGQSM